MITKKIDNFLNEADKDRITANALNKGCDVLESMLKQLEKFEDYLGDFGWSLNEKADRVLDDEMVAIEESINKILKVLNKFK